MKLLIQLLSEIPEDTVVATYLDGNPPVTAKQMKVYAEQRHVIAKTFMSDLLRISRDVLIRRANR